MNQISCQDQSPFTSTARAQRYISKPKDGAEIPHATKVHLLSLFLNLVQGSSVEKTGNPKNGLMAAHPACGKLAHSKSRSSRCDSACDYLDIFEKKDKFVRILSALRRGPTWLRPSCITIIFAFLADTRHNSYIRYHAYAFFPTSGRGANCRPRSRR